MHLGQILAHRYPDAEFMEDYAVQDDRAGPYISFWNEATMGPQPTPAEIASWELPAARFYKRREMRRAADAEYEAIFAIDGEFLDMERDNIVLKTAMGLALSNAEQTKRGQMRATRDKLVTKIQGVNALATLAEVEAVGW